MSLGWRIAKAREEDEKRHHEKESQQQLADALGVKREIVAYWESGARVPKPEQIAAIAEHCHVSADFLLGLTENTTRDEDLRSVCDYTGLVEDAVMFLHFLRDRPVEERKTTEFINTVLKEAARDMDPEHHHFTLFSLMQDYVSSKGAKRVLHRKYVPSPEDSPETRNRELEDDERASRYVLAAAEGYAGELMEFADLYREMKMTQIRSTLDALLEMEQKKKARR